MTLLLFEDDMQTRDHPERKPREAERGVIPGARVANVPDRCARAGGDLAAAMHARRDHVCIADNHPGVKTMVTLPRRVA